MKHIVYGEDHRNGELTVEVYPTLVAANRAAELAWDHLTAREQRQNHIIVYAVDDDFDLDEPDSNGMDAPKGEGFDSGRWYAVMADDEDIDHGTGSWYLSEAVEDCLWRYPDTGYIAVVDPADDYCIEMYTHDEVETLMDERPWVMWQ